MKSRLIITIILSLIIGFGGGFWCRGSFGRGGWESPWKDPDAVLTFLTRKLELNEDQVSKVRPIVVGAQEKLSALRRKIRPEFQSIHDETHDAIAVLLNEEQRQTLAELRKEFEARRQARRDEREKRDDN